MIAFPITLFTAATTFTPGSLPNLKAWWRADLGVTSSGGLVSAWADQSGNSNNLSVFNASYKPSISSTGFNSNYYGISFTGTANSNVGTGLSGTVTFPSTATFSLAVALTWSPANNFERMSTWTDTANGNNDYNTAGNFAFSLNSDTNNPTTDQAYANSVQLAPLSFPTGTACTLMIVSDGSNLKIYLNNSSSASTAYSTALTANQYFNLATSCGGAGFNGVIAEEIFTASALSSTDRTNLQSYFHTRYGI